MNIHLRKSHKIIWLLILAGGFFLFGQFYKYSTFSPVENKANSAQFTSFEKENIDLIINSYPAEPGLTIYFANNPYEIEKKHFIRTIGQLGRYIVSWDFESKFIHLYDDINGNFLESIEIKDYGL